MVNILERVSTALYTAGTTCMDTAVELKKGALWVGEESSSAMYDIYSMQGFENWSKALIADMKFISAVFPRCDGVFDLCIRTLEAQKELLYATKVFESTPDFIERDPNEPGRYQLKSNMTLLTTLYGIANPLDTLYFLQKYKVVSFPLITRLASELGSVKLFSFQGEIWKCQDLPVFGAIFSKPKDVLIFWASGIQAYECCKIQGNAFWNYSNLFKLAGSIGKIILIGAGGPLSKTKWSLVVTIVDIFTQNASLFAMLLKRHQDRERRRAV